MYGDYNNQAYNNGNNNGDGAGATQYAQFAPAGYGAGFQPTAGFPMATATTGSPVYATSPSTAAPGNCQMTMETLERQLQASGYGQNQDIFRCYFAPGVFPPRCAACNRLVQEHDSASRGGAQNAYNSPNHQQQAVVMGFGITAGAGGIVEPKVCSGETVDTYSDTFLVVFAIVGGILLSIGVILFVVFFSNGLVSKAPQVLIGPSILTLLGLIFTSIPSRTVLSFDKTKRIMSYKKYKLNPMLFCCGESAEVAFESMQSVQQESTSVMVNRVPQVEVVLVCRDNNNQQRSLPLTMVGLFSVAGVQAGWQQYLRRIGCTVA